MSKPSNLDPVDWDEFSQQAHDFLDICIERLKNSAEHPWQDPAEISGEFALNGSPHDLSDLTQSMAQDILPYHSGNTHPRFWGWVQGTGLATGLISEMAATTMNSNCGGRDHALVYVEREVIEWARKTFEFPVGTSGILTSGTSLATVYAFHIARIARFGQGSRSKAPDLRNLRVYASDAVHNAIPKAMELLGIGSENLVRFRDFSPDHLKAKIEEDQISGYIPFAIVATAGSVDLGRFDPIDLMADLAAEYQLWLHIDGAFGAWLKLAENSDLRQNIAGIERADSLACDFHKWMSVNYDCGMLLVRDEEAHRSAFAARPNYLAPQDQGVGGGDPWYCDYGIELSRGPRALKVWSAIKHFGDAAFAQAIQRNCDLAQYMAQAVNASMNMAMIAPVVSNICVFTANRHLDLPSQSELNKSIAIDLQKNGIAVFSTTVIDGLTVLRAAIVNHRTRYEDVDLALTAITKLTEVKS